LHTHTETNDPRHNLKVALALARAGIRIFPAAVKPTGGSRGWLKQPLIKGWSANASADDQQINGLWRKYPFAVPGIPLEHINGIVIDLDRHGEHDGVEAFNDLVEIHGPLPNCPVTETPGDGLHLIFRQPFGKRLGNRTGELPAGVDVRGYGGWIVAPGSLRPDGKAWGQKLGTLSLPDAIRTNKLPIIPQWTVDLIEPKPRREEPLPRYDMPNSEFGSYAQRTLTLICGDLARMKEGRRNTELNNAAMRLGSMVARGWIDHHAVIDGLTDAALASGLTPDEVQETLASGFTAGLRNPAKDPEDRPPPGRMNGAKQYGAQNGANYAKVPETKPGELVVVKGSDLVMKPVRWAWQNRIAMGKSMILAGEPGVSKSTLLLYIGAQFSVGGEWPYGGGNAPKGDVIVLSAEDDPADTIKPRFVAAGGNPEKLHIIRAVRADDVKRGFNLQADMGQLEALIRRLGGVGCVIIDPVSSYMGKVDSHKNSEVRGVIDPLTEMASSTGWAFLLNTHFTKSASGNKTKAIFRFVGSIAFVGAARTGFCVVHDPDDKNRRLVLPVKTNIGPEAEGLAYTLEQVLAGYYEEDGTKEEVWASRIVWADAPVSISADQAIAAGEVGVTSNPREREPSATEAVTEFLQEILRYGPVEVTDIERDARKAGLLKDGQRANDAKPFRLAKKELQIASKREGFGPDGRFIWMLPEREPIRDY